MSTTRTLAVLFTSFLLFFTTFWFTSPSYFSSLVCFSCLQRAIPWLRDEGIISPESLADDYLSANRDLENVVILEDWWPQRPGAIRKIGYVSRDKGVTISSSFLEASTDSSISDERTDQYINSADYFKGNKEQLSLAHGQKGKIAKVMRPVISQTDSRQYSSNFGSLSYLETKQYSGESKVSLTTRIAEEGLNEHAVVEMEEVPLEVAKIKMPLIVNEDTVVLSVKNFSDIIANNRYVVVNFHLQRARRSKYAVSEYAAAATVLKDRVVFAKVDASVETELAQKYAIQAYPRLHFYIDGVYMHTYYNCCRRDPVVGWLKEKISGGVRNLTETWQAMDVQISDRMIILGFFDTLEGPDSKEFAAASEQKPDIIFYQTASADIVNMLNIDPDVQRPSLFMMRADAREFIRFDGQFTKSAIADFVSMSMFPLVTTFNKQNANQLLDHPMKQLWLCDPKKDSKNYMPDFLKAAELFNGKLLFVYMEMNVAYKKFNRQPCLFDYIQDHPVVVAYPEHPGSLTYLIWSPMSYIKSFADHFLNSKLQCVTPMGIPQLRGCY